MEILVNSIKEIDIKNLKVEDWYKIINKNIELGIVVCRKYVITVCFEYKDKCAFLWDYYVTVKDLKYYLKLLLNAISIDSVHYTESLMRHKVRIGDIIIFEDGTKAKISPYPEDGFSNLRYKKFKKNDELGLKNYIFYGGTEFKIMR